MNVVRKEDVYTIDDIYALPEGERAELIDGKIYDMVSPGRTHQKLLHFFDRTIGNYIESNQGGCEIYPAPFAVFLNDDDRNYLEPDFSVICDQSKLDEKGCHGAPDWIVEIVSPGSRQMDYYKKLFKYHTAGAREYWIIDSEKEQATVYRFEKETMDQYSFNEEIPVGIYEGFSIRIS
ncbi:MAG: Uma2 family endonuclease [Ruminococcus sp.]|nr:Uma2 family endonuclease [Ruminococcus sp.]